MWHQTRAAQRSEYPACAIASRSLNPRSFLLLSPSFPRYFPAHAAHHLLPSPAFRIGPLLPLTHPPASSQHDAGIRTYYDHYLRLHATPRLPLFQPVTSLLKPSSHLASAPVPARPRLDTMRACAPALTWCRPTVRIFVATPTTYLLSSPAPHLLLASLAFVATSRHHQPLAALASALPASP
jgi:hypothetical protein